MLLSLLLRCPWQAHSMTCQALCPPTVLMPCSTIYWAGLRAVVQPLPLLQPSILLADKVFIPSLAKVQVGIGTGAWYLSGYWVGVRYIPLHLFITPTPSTGTGSFFFWYVLSFSLSFFFANFYFCSSPVTVQHGCPLPWGPTRPHYWP